MTRLTTRIAHRTRAAAGGIAIGAAIAVAAAIPAAATAGTSGTNATDANAIHHYKVTITNLTKGQPLSPPVITTNYGSGEIFKVGSAANWGVEQISENGNSDPLFDGLQADQKAGYVTGLVRADAPLLPKGTPGGKTFKDSVTLIVAGKAGQRINLIAMLGCTNDGFIGVNSARLPKAPGRTVKLTVGDWDAGTEENTEDFADLTPTCQAAIGVKSRFGATGATETDWQLAENGVIHRHERVQETSDDGLVDAVHGWKHNKAAKVTVTEVD